MFGKNQKVEFGTMYPNQRIALIMDGMTGKKTLYKLHEITGRDKLFYSDIETFILNGIEYVATKMPTVCSLG